MSRSAFTQPPVALQLNGSPPAVSSDVAIGDWEELLSAVKSRLRSTVGELLAVLPEHQLPDAAHRVQASVLECVNALDQLHLTLSHELARRQQLEREVVETHAVLARARDQLTATRADEHQARHLASHDSLTALPNRGRFRERLAHALADPERRRRGLALLCVDLDGFKAVNDEHGHDAGDEMLRIVAARLARSVRADDMVGRVGGDEFACLLADVPNREQLSHLACKVFDAVGAPMKIGQLKLTIHASIGIAVCPTDGASAEGLLKSADDAMVRAKRQNTGYAFFAEGATVDARVTE
ncbi:MAG: GGDEF domain-containing protein [Telluria sp.]|nr:GGDEF domain-containing protein [Telluria sp.]